MSTRRYDWEIQAATAFVAYLEEVLDADLLAGCPAVTFFDPMSTDEADRIVVRVPSGGNQPESKGNAACVVELVLKTRWTQKTMAADFAKHFERLNFLRGAVLSPTVTDDMNTAAAEKGIGVDYVQPRIDFATEVYEGGSIKTETRITVNVFAVDR